MRGVAAYFARSAQGGERRAEEVTAQTNTASSTAAALTLKKGSARKAMLETTVSRTP
jgi:hypothetical protein